MSVLVNEKTSVVVQGLTGREGSFHAEQMMEYGTKVVGGVTPGKGGAKHGTYRCSIPFRSGAGNRRGCIDYFCSAAVCRGRCS